MKWLTVSQVKKHATTPVKALNISIKHWQQIVDATAKEIREYTSNNPESLFSRYLCGLCEYYKNVAFASCQACLLALIGEECVRGDETDPYSSAWDAYVDWASKEGSYQTFKKEAREMLKILKSLKGKK